MDIQTNQQVIIKLLLFNNLFQWFVAGIGVATIMFIMYLLIIIISNLNIEIIMFGFLMAFFWEVFGISYIVQNQYSFNFASLDHGGVIKVGYCQKNSASVKWKKKHPIYQSKI